MSMLELSGAKVLITGGAGFIGSHLADSLLRLGCTVIVLDNFDDFYQGKEENVKHNLSNPRYMLVRGDIRDASLVNSIAAKADIVFHLAAQAGIRYCNADPIKANSVNVDGTINVLNSCRVNKVKKLVYASSSSVYGEPIRIPMDEDHPTNPISVYGASKLAAEKYCLAYWKSYSLPVVCLRYFSVYGPRGRPDQVIHSFVKSISQNRRPVIYGGGSQSRDFTFISDVVSATILAAIREESTGHVINVGYGKEYKISTVAMMVASCMNSEILPVHKPAYSGDFPRTLCSNRKAEQLLGWKAQVSLKEGLAQFVSWFLKREKKVYQEVS